MISGTTAYNLSTRRLVCATLGRQAWSPDQAAGSINCNQQAPAHISPCPTTYLLTVPTPPPPSLSPLACSNFEVEYEAFGETRKVELLPGGSDLAVTGSNRAQFVALYTAWLLTGSVADQFAAFASGFHRVCGGPALSLFR